MAVYSWRAPQLLESRKDFLSLLGFREGPSNKNSNFNLSLRLMAELDLARILLMHGCPCYTYLGTRTTSNFCFREEVPAIREWNICAGLFCLLQRRPTYSDRKRPTFRQFGMLPHVCQLTLTPAFLWRGLKFLRAAGCQQHRCSASFDNIRHRPQTQQQHQQDRHV